ncbi:uncharacterized protein [Lolium perenne]|uniref:uncharacterized protein n=1 Tax=Lolium perenne TaxID=4522 RepID=UPI0021F54BA9|nr:uncharacterized protein LOC127340866 [Lolium perenne]
MEVEDLLHGVRIAPPWSSPRGVKEEMVVSVPELRPSATSWTTSPICGCRRPATSPTYCSVPLPSPQLSTCSVRHTFSGTHVGGEIERIAGGSAILPAPRSAALCHPAQACPSPAPRAERATRAKRLLLVVVIMLFLTYMEDSSSWLFGGRGVCSGGSLQGNFERSLCRCDPWSGDCDR